ncbi:MAG: hypothetical protein WC756_22195 [Taibaiella sp.]
MNKHDRIDYINNLLSQDINRDETLDKYQKNATNKWTKPPIPSEFSEHTEFIAQMRKKYPFITPVYIHNGGSRTPREKVDQMRLGLCPGASDIFFPQLFAWVEMKKTKNYEQSESQKKFEIMVIESGYKYILGIGCDDAMKKIEEVINKNNL